MFGEDALGEHDNDLTRQHEGDPLGERIVVGGGIVLSQRNQAGFGAPASSPSASPATATPRRSSLR